MLLKRYHAWKNLQLYNTLLTLIPLSYLYFLQIHFR